MDDIFFNFKVKCILDPDDIRDMQVHFTLKTDNTYINLPCNGCDFAYNTKECKLCMNTITKIFFENPSFRPTTPVNIFNYL